MRAALVSEQKYISTCCFTRATNSSSRQIQKVKKNKKQSVCLFMVFVRFFTGDKDWAKRAEQCGYTCATHPHGWLAFEEVKSINILPKHSKIN